MTEAGAGQGQDERFERYLSTFERMGLPAPLQISQLLRAGFPAELVRTRFPGQPESLFIAPTPALEARRRPQAPAGAAAAGQGVSPSALTGILRQVTQRATPGAPGEPGEPRAPGGAPHPAPLPRTNPASAVTDPAGSWVDGISFQYVPLIQCSFPHADPGGQTHFTRRNGWLELTLSTARAETGLPYGVPARLLTIYCASEALRTRSPEIFLGASMHEFLRRLEVPITRGERGSLRVYANQLLRLIHCAVSIDENVRDSSGRTGLHIRQALFAEEARLWWDDERGVGQGSSLVLSPVLFDSMLERAAPLSTRAIRQLRKSPMDLDVYAWLAHRLFQLVRPSTISWTQLSAQFGHDYGELRYFRRFFGDSLKRVLKVYPEAMVRWTDAGLTLLPSKPHIARIERSRA